MFWVYVLENAEGGYYIGQTFNVAKRLEEHNDVEARGSKYTAKNGPWKLVWSEAHSDRASAMRRERQIKKMKSAKWIRKNLLNEIL